MTDIWRLRAIAFDPGNYVGKSVVSDGCARVALTLITYTYVRVHPGTRVCAARTVARELTLQKVGRPKLPQPPHFSRPCRGPATQWPALAIGIRPKFAGCVFVTCQNRVPLAMKSSFQFVRAVIYSVLLRKRYVRGVQHGLFWRTRFPNRAVMISDL